MKNKLEIVLKKPAIIGIFVLGLIPSAIKAQVKSQPLEVVGKMFEAFGKGDMESLKKTVSEKTVWIYEGPRAIPYTGSYEGKKGVVQFITNISSNVEILDFKVLKMLAENNTVVALGYEKQKIKVNGNILEQKWVQVYTVENGLITRMEEYANTAAAERLFKKNRNGKHNRSHFDKKS
ncbi:hypothetical protein ACM46_11310 [Chryseobacterium angstadtii]|uniref:SnoaL-like domain-containing protein n=1 Tax=Chryseobacterium angstadtii TaxID=558151 RepID=A0A0J7IF91_9FLAO|nr:nuclear transport factor 2 family protein [Chryseobacterium angstadtii]KMQ64807.1 hypothetical protein ACM46_11310 [Chryseobacterium angstadtii]